MPENSSTIDWIGYTFHNMSADLEQKDLYPPGLTRRGFQRNKGLLGYPIVWEFEDGRLELNNPNNTRMGTHVIYSGSTLATLYYSHGLTPLEILQFYFNKATLARLDLCHDIFEQRINFDQLIRQAKRGKAVTRAKNVKRVKEILGTGDTLYVGSETSEKRCRIYDKAAEQELIWLQWTRVELQTRNDVAREVELIIQANNYQVGVIPELIRGFIDFPDYDQWHAAFDVDSLEVTVPRSRVSSSREWLQKQVIRAIAREIAKEDGDEWWIMFKQTILDAAKDEVRKYMDKDEWDNIPF